MWQQKEKLLFKFGTSFVQLWQPQPSYSYVISDYLWCSYWWLQSSTYNILRSDFSLCSLGFCACKVVTNSFCTVTQLQVSLGKEKKDNIYSYVLTVQMQPTFCSILVHSLPGLSEKWHLFYTKMPELQGTKSEHLKSSLNSRCCNNCLCTHHQYKNLFEQAYFHTIKYLFRFFLYVSWMLHCMRHSVKSFEIYSNLCSYLQNMTMTIMSYYHIKRMSFLFYFLWLELLGADMM